MDVKEGIAPQEQQRVLDFYTNFGPTTEPGSHLDTLKKLPSGVEELAPFIKGLQLHPAVIKDPKLLFDDYLEGVLIDYKARYFRENKKELSSEDKELSTVAKILDAALTRDSDISSGEYRWYVNRARVSCAAVAYLLTATERAHGIPARVRVGFADWFPETQGKTVDHWISEIWNAGENRWVQVDMDGMYDILRLKEENFSWHDLPKGRFTTGGEAWLNARNGKINPEVYRHTLKFGGYQAIGWQFAFDYSQIVGEEWTYWYHPEVFKDENIDAFLQNEEQMKMFDQMAELMQDPDRNFDAIQTLYKENEIFHPVKYED